MFMEDKMKKLLLVSAFAVAGLINTASASDRTGKWAIGYQDQFGAATGNAGSWSFKYGVKSNVTAQAILGFNTGEPVNDNLTVGLRGLYDIAENENSQLYTGVGVLFVTIDDNNKAMQLNVPVGVEFNAPSLPELAFSIEGGLNIDFPVDVAGDPDFADTVSINTSSSTIGGNLRLGVHYYF